MKIFLTPDDWAHQAHNVTIRILTDFFIGRKIPQDKTYQQANIYL
jgi:hypothetical protein